jgi:prolyl oligopeptidase
VVRSFAVSKDGTPSSAQHHPSQRRQARWYESVLPNGYGGYGISQKPSFAGSQTRVWLDQGGVSATANLRGGGEYGEEWHKQGNLTRKQNVFDDFIACAQ